MIAYDEDGNWLFGRGCDISYYREGLALIPSISEDQAKAAAARIAAEVKKAQATVVVPKQSRRRELSVVMRLALDR